MGRFLKSCMRGSALLEPMEFEDADCYGEPVVLEAEPGIVYVGTEVLVTGLPIEVANTVPRYAELDNDFLVSDGNHFCLGLSFCTEQWSFSLQCWTQAIATHPYCLVVISGLMFARASTCVPTPEVKKLAMCFQFGSI